jgi:hypothetical protein
MVQVGSCPECQKEVALGDALATDGDVQLCCPHCDLEFARDKLTLREVPELLLAGAAADAAAHDQLTDTSPAVNDSQPLLGGADVGAEEDVEPGHVSPIDMPVVTASGARQEYDAQISTQPRVAQAGGSRSFFRQLVGIAGGGVIGLAIGYYVLLWIGGPQKDFLEIGHRLPPWAVPAAFHRVEVRTAPSQDDARRSLADLLDADDEGRDELGLPVEPEGMPPAPLPGEQVPAVDAIKTEVAVLDPPKRTTADLEAALQAAADVRLSLVAGELNDPALRPLKSSAYRAFAALADAVTFAQATPGREAEHKAFATQAEQLLVDTLVSERMKGQLGGLAAEWLDAAGRDSKGVVAAGHVAGSHMGIADQRGILVELAGTTRRLAVVGPHAIDAPRGANVVVVGTLIDKPHVRIGGYTGSADQVVWAGLVLQ